MQQFVLLIKLYTIPRLGGLNIIFELMADKTIHINMNQMFK